MTAALTDVFVGRHQREVRRRCVDIQFILLLRDAHRCQLVPVLWHRARCRLGRCGDDISSQYFKLVLTWRRQFQRRIAGPYRREEKSGTPATAEVCATVDSCVGGAYRRTFRYGDSVHIPHAGRSDP